MANGLTGRRWPCGGIGQATTRTRPRWPPLICNGNLTTTGIWSKYHQPAAIAWSTGASKIVGKARQKAPSWSIDPDRWFKNVEVVMLRTVSQEPVQYVVNINRYFLLFDQYFKVLEQRELVREKAGEY